jgi:HAD superfamily hydrolase (TIGR01509 family)
LCWSKAAWRLIFCVTFDGAQVARPKPAPDIYLMAAGSLHIAPGNCIVFEDSIPGVKAALLAGMRVVGFADDAP